MSDLGERASDLGRSRDESYFPILNEERRVLEPQNPQNQRVVLGCPRKLVNG